MGPSRTRYYDAPPPSRYARIEHEMLTRCWHNDQQTCYPTTPDEWEFVFAKLFGSIATLIVVYVILKTVVKHT